MKRIYMALALVGALASESKAQSIDLEGAIALPADGQVMGPHQTLDTSKVLMGVIYHGPDGIQGGDVFRFVTSCSKADTAGVYYDYVQFGSSANITSPADTGKPIFLFPNANQIGHGHTGAFKLSSDSVRVMLDWTKWTQDTLKFVYPPYENGKSYGFFIFAGVLVDGSTGTPLSTDPNTSNNWAAQRVVWNSTTGIQEFGKKEKTEINLYPNPATDVIGFDFNHAKGTHSTVVIRDINGRVVYTKNYGFGGAGLQHYSVDISKLSTGNYIMELDMDEQTAVSKFSKK